MGGGSSSIPKVEFQLDSKYIKFKILNYLRILTSRTRGLVPAPVDFLAREDDLKWR